MGSVHVDRSRHGRRHRRWSLKGHSSWRHPSSEYLQSALWIKRSWILSMLLLWLVLIV